MNRMHAWIRVVVACATFGLIAKFSIASDPPQDLQTVAERSGYTATSRYADVVALIDKLKESSKSVTSFELGKTVQGRAIPAVVVADPPVSTAQQAARSGKMVAVLIGNIHAGEVEGKEALMMLAREIATANPEGDDAEKAARALLKDFVLVFVPIYNADGNENVGPVGEKRPGQNGPTGGDGVGTRENADGLDLNRDYIKLEAPETRALVRCFDEWDPALFIDCHTTNGSHHRYTLTYMGPTNPAGPEPILTFVRDSLLPEVSKRMEASTGYKSFFYGNFEGRDEAGAYTKWTTYPDLPRYGGPYVGLRNRLSVLSEAYSYAPFKDRVLATREFCRLTLAYVAEKKDDVRRMIREADDKATSAGREPSDKSPEIVLRTEVRSFKDKATVLGFVEENKDGHRTSTDQPRDYVIDVVNDFVPTATTKRPFAYVFPKTMGKVVENLQRHGVQVEELREDLELDVESQRIDTVTKAMRPFQNHSILDIATTASNKSVRFPAGSIVVRTAQKLGTLAAYMLEPRASDGLAAWNFFDDQVKVGEEFPVVRVMSATPMLTTRVRPLADRREMNKAITYDNSSSLNFSGSPTGGMRWLDDGEHYLQVRDGVLRKVDALTGRSEKYLDTAPMVAALAKLPTIGEATARSLAGSPSPAFNPQRTGAMFTYENDLYYAAVDGSVGVRLTSTPEAEEFPSFSPDGKFIAFIKSNDVWVVDIDTRTERRLTTGGTDLVRNGKNDWVYYEEVFNRVWQAYWWSPDSKHIAFYQIDSTNVPRFKLPADHLEPRIIEDAPYPRPGEGNPAAKFGVVSVAGGSVRWADLSDYDPGQFLITDAGWLSPGKAPGSADAAPESRTAFCYIQNRTQTWMDLLAVPVGGGQPKRLMRETTQAWVEPQGAPVPLKDGTFIMASERDGYRHLYHFDKDGKLINQITRGEFEARSIARLDEAGGLIYFNATEKSSIASNLYRVKLDGSEMTMVSASKVSDAIAAAIDHGSEAPAPTAVTMAGNGPATREGGVGGGHSISFSPNGKYYVDVWSDYSTPTKTALFRADGSLARVLDTNPVYSVEEYKRGSFQLMQVAMSDGFKLEASLLKPPDFDPSKKYPVWLMTYAGPHAPTVSDSWGGGRTYDEMLAQMGIVVFRVDPRSASGKGAVSAWSAYKQLGVQELKDLEEAVAWLAAQPGIDGSRVGIAGGSYGGFMTCYALTHSKAFAAGIATAPVCDWREYDSIYTERYMLVPQDNPDGYDKTSVVKAAGNLHGKLLLIHGTMDDNVHMVNSIKFIRGMQDANKQFEFMTYPGSRHGVGGEHVRKMSIDFIRKTLLDAPPVVEEKKTEDRGERPRGPGRRRNQESRP